jgi:hypothetical protein
MGAAIKAVGKQVMNIMAAKLPRWQTNIVNNQKANLSRWRSGIKIW